MSARILIVEDDHALRFSMGRWAQRAGYESLEAEDAETAIEVLENQSADVIIVDIRLPGMDGLALSQLLIEKEPDRPVLLTTAFADLESAREALSIGVHAYITKPFSLTDILNAVELALDHRRLLLENKQYQEDLKAQVRARTTELRRTNDRLQKEIENQKKTQEALRKSQQTYESLVNRIDGIVWEADPSTLKFTFVSKQAEKLLGFSVAEWTEKADFWKYHIHPEDRNWVIAFCRDAVEEKQDHTFDYRMMADDGRVVWLRSMVSVVVEEEDQKVKLLGIMVDVTESKQAEQTLRESEERFRNIFSQSNESIFVIDPEEDQILDVNPKACSFLEYEREELLTLSIADIHPGDTPKMKAFVRSVLLEGTGWTDELACKTKTGRMRFVEISASTIQIEEKFCLISLVRDITERKETERRMVRLERLRALGEMSAGVSHNLNNILTGIVGPAQLIEMFATDEKVLREAKSIRESVQRAADLVKRLHQSVSVVEEDSLQPVNVHQAIQEAVDATRPRWKDESELRS